MLNEIRKEGMIEIAKRMLEDKELPLEKIAKYSGLSLNELKELQEKL